MTDVGDLHNEAEMMPADAHVMMLSHQFYSGMMHQEHPCHAMVQREPPPRLLKKTIKRYCHDKVLQMTDGVVGRKEQLSAIHTQMVSESLPDSKLLGCRPPKSGVNRVDEQKLPRRHQRILAQLRSGYCPLLQDYKQRVDGPSGTRGAADKNAPDASVVNLMKFVNRPLTDPWEHPADTMRDICDVIEC